MQTIKERLAKITIPVLVFSSVTIAFIRLYYCLINPFYSQDMLRNLWYGLYMVKYGLKAAASPLIALNPSLSEITFSQFPCQYPIITMLFFTLAAVISPSAFFVKLCLTLIEAVNSLLIYRITGDRFISLLYWASPVSIIWVSQEGQFEPLQNLFVFLAFLLLSRSTVSAFFILSIAIQTKMSALLILPYFIYRAYSSRNLSITVFIGFLAGFTPTFIAQYLYPCLQNVFKYSALLLYNPYYWNFKAIGIFTFKHPVYMVFNQVTSYGFLIILAYGAYRSRDVFSYLAAFIFMLFCKLHSNVNFWYMIVIPSLLIPIEHKKMRRLLFTLAIFLDVAALVEILRTFGADRLLCHFMDVSKLDRLNVPFP